MNTFERIAVALEHISATLDDMNLRAGFSMWPPAPEPAPFEDPHNLAPAPDRGGEDVDALLGPA